MDSFNDSGIGTLYPNTLLGELGFKGKGTAKQQWDRHISDAMDKVKSVNEKTLGESFGVGEARQTDNAMENFNLQRNSGENVTRQGNALYDKEAFLHKGAKSDDFKELRTDENYNGNSTKIWNDRTQLERDLPLQGLNTAKISPQNQTNPQRKLTQEQIETLQQKYGTKKGNGILANMANNQLATMATGGMVGMSALPSDGSFKDRARNAVIGALAFKGIRDIPELAKMVQKTHVENVKTKFGENSDEYLNALQKYEQDNHTNGFKDISGSNNFLVNTFRDFRRYFSNTMSKEVNDLKSYGKDLQIILPK